MLDARFRPLDKWTREPKLGEREARFRMGYVKTLDLLEHELQQLGAYEVIIEAGFARGDLRNDGWPRGGVRPRHPGVVLHFKNADGPMEFPCGTYARYEDNLHAIALTLENLRAIDRYGVTLAHQQYLGFLALPAPAKAWSIDEAAEWLAARTPWARNAQELLADHDKYRRAYRESAAALHPDRGGSDELFQVLGMVAKLLDEHHKGAKAGAA